MSANIVIFNQESRCMPTYRVQSSVDVFRQARVNVCKEQPNPMSANIVKVIFNQESMYANLSRELKPESMSAKQATQTQCLPM